MSRWFGRFLAALRFLTIFPLPGSRGATTTELQESLVFFPVAGLLLGLFCACGAFILWRVLPGWPAAVLLLALLHGLSGGLHLDGLADTADGFFSSRPREGILTIMRDSRTGPMGVIALVIVLLFQAGALAGLERPTIWRAALLMPLAGRCAIILMMAILPYARSEGGLAALFYSSGLRPAKVSAGLFGMGLFFLLAGPGAWAGVLLLLSVTLGFSWYCRRKIGGATGDTLGAGCVLAESSVALFFSLQAGSCP